MNSNLILIVDDDKSIRDFLQLTLGKSGYATVTASNPQEARKLLQPTNLDAITCVLTDYLMPNENGLGLLAWIQQADPDLATILVTSENERELVARSLREGAIDFLDKPIDRAQLEAAVARATQRTKLQRARATAHGAVQTLARTQKRMLSSINSRGVAKLEICFQPKHEAGGDFISHIEIVPGKQFYILTDVSGHDLQAAYISAYFHGMLRGMLARSTPVEEVIEYFNGFLVNEWNHSDPAKGHSPLLTSISISAILLDSTTNSATIWNNGSPSPVYMSNHGSIKTNANSGGPPLGWFSDVATQGHSHPACPGDAFLMWTDGLVDLAERRGVNPLSLAFALRAAQMDGKPLPVLNEATDDILLAAFRLGAELRPDRFEPIFVEIYEGPQWNQIDELQARWERSLQLAVPDIAESTLVNVILATREAVLNGLIHGCQKREGESTTLEITFRPSESVFRVSVLDTGAGHNFDLEAHQARTEHELVDEHRGLILIKQLASSLNFELAGRWVIMTFNSDNPQPNDILI